MVIINLQFLHGTTQISQMKVLSISQVGMRLATQVKRITCIPLNQNGTANSTPGGNTQNAIGGRTKYALLADGKTIKTDASGNPVKTTGGFGNQFSIPSANEKPSGDTVHYYRKTDEKGNVYVHYKDTEGTTIKDSVTDEDKQPINKAYDTVVDNRPDTIEYNGKTYELVPAGTYTVGQVDSDGHLTTSDDVKRFSC